MGPIETQMHLTHQQLRQLSGFDHPIDPQTPPPKKLTPAEEWTMEKMEVPWGGK
jgi:hypothetical protein